MKRRKNEDVETYKSEHDWLKSKLGDDYLGTFELWSVTVNGAKEEYYSSSYHYNLVIKK